MSDKLSNSDNPANREHLCAKQVVHEKWGKGECIPTMHSEATEDGHVAWYDIMFEHGIETRVPVEVLEITLAESHSHSKKKMSEGKTEKCETCEGTGEVGGEDCSDCNGTGKVTIDEAGKMQGGEEDPCWKGYKMVGMKKGKNGEDVPNCVPIDEATDPVDPKELKGKLKDRKDADIDNDGDVDDSDKFLHKRRKAIAKALSKED